VSAAFTAIVALGGVVIGGALTMAGQRRLWLRQQRTEAYGAFSSAVTEMAFHTLQQRASPRPQREWADERSGVMQRAYDAQARLSLVASLKVRRVSEALVDTLLNDFSTEPDAPIPPHFDAQKEAFINACQDDLVASRWWRPSTLRRVAPPGA
jgi:hypothetical protein